MINSIPANWEYSDELEMLFLFYQCSDELLSENSPDTYALPFHNALSLVYEIEYIYSLLYEYQIINKYYTAYIPIIIDEFLCSLSKDYILKKILGYRLDSLKTGFIEAKENHVLLQRWIDLFKQSCSIEHYISQLSEEITNIVTQNKCKKDMLFCAKSFFVCMIISGHSREYLYQFVKRFFDNSSRKITNKFQISDFLSQLDYLTKDFDFLVLMDVDEIEYFESINMKLRFFKKITRVDVQKERKGAC